MAKRDYLPKTRSEYLRWHDRFLAGLLEVLADLGLTAADKKPVADDNAALHADAAEADRTAGLAKAATAKLSQTLAASHQNARKLVRRIKDLPAYTDALGQQLSIIGEETVTDLSGAKPTLTATAQRGGVVVLDFPKGDSEGVNIYSQREGDSAFGFLARDTQSPYVDNRPLLAAGKPEIRKYKAVYVLGDDEVGLPSDEVSATAAP
jgi:hypothetical protein